jgi:hypothetical protein
MPAPIQIALVVLLAAVAVPLVFGLMNLIRGGDPARSQRLMRWRIGLQASAVLLAFVTVYWFR